MCTVAMEPDSANRKPKLVTSGLVENPSLLRHDKKLNSKLPNVKPEDIKSVASAVAACKLGLVDQLVTILETSASFVDATDIEGRTCLHYAAGYGHEECVETLLGHNASVSIQDCNGDTPLHFAAVHGHPMCAYTLGKADPGTCLARNTRGQTPVEVAAACERREVLNAMLLSCAGESGSVAVQAMKLLLVEGAVPDTWAPNGSSALMLAASANGTEALQVLLDNGASIELQDALGRSALMFAAGNGAADALNTLLDAGACIAARDRRGRSALEYAADGSNAKQLLQDRLQALEDVAAKLQEDLLASLDTNANSKGNSSRSKSKRKKSKAGKRGKAEGPKSKPMADASDKPACYAELEEEQFSLKGQTIQQQPQANLAVKSDVYADTVLVTSSKILACTTKPDETDSGPIGLEHTSLLDVSSDVDRYSVYMSVNTLNEEDDDPNAWQLVGNKGQRSNSKSQNETVSQPAMKRPASKPLAIPNKSSQASRPTIAAGCISHPTPFHSASDSTCHESYRATLQRALKPPVPLSSYKLDSAPRSALATALKFPPASITQQRDAAWPSRPQGTPLAFKAALLGRSSPSPCCASSSPRSTCSSSTVGFDTTLSDLSSGPTPAEFMAAAQDAAGVLQPLAESDRDIGNRSTAGNSAVSAGGEAKRTVSCASVGVQASLESDVEALRRQVSNLQASQQQLRRQLQIADLQHQQELSAVLEDAAQHKLEAMAMAAQHERCRISTQLQLLGFNSELLRALLDPATMDFLSLIDAPHTAIPLHPSSSSPWSPPLFDTPNISTSPWSTPPIPCSTRKPLASKAMSSAPFTAHPISFTPLSSSLASSLTMNLSTSVSAPFQGFDSPLLPGLNYSSRNGSKGSFTESASNPSLAMSPLSIGSPCMSATGHSCATSLFSKPWGDSLEEPLAKNDLPNLPESLDDDFSMRLTAIMEQSDRFTPFGCAKQLHSFVDPIKDIPLPESALVGHH